MMMHHKRDGGISERVFSLQMRFWGIFPQKTYEPLQNKKKEEKNSAQVSHENALYVKHMLCGNFCQIDPDK